VADVVGPQVGQEGPQTVDHPEEVDGEDPTEVRQRQLCDRQAAAPDTGVVADEVHVTEVLERRRRERLHVGLDADIGGHGEHVGAATAELLGRPAQDWSLDVRQHQLHALAPEAVRHGQADARCRPGDHRDPACEIVHR
jgi:hypothetical protein